MSATVSDVASFEISDFEVGYDGRAVLSCAELELFPGEVLALLGASGTGKTTMFSAIAGNAASLKGTLAFSKEKVEGDWLRQNVARTLQNHPLLHWLTVEGNIRLAARLRRVPRQNPMHPLEQVSAEHLLHRWPATLSGGERCRVSLAMCLVSQPEILLLDEPFNGLDAVVKREAASAVRAFVKQQQCAAIITTHDIEDALECSRKVAVIRKGRPGISQVGPVWEVPADRREWSEFADRILAALA